MDRSEIKVWVLLTLYGGVGLAIFTTGLFAFNDQHYPLGVAFTVAGLGVTADAGRRALGHGFTVPNSVLAVMLALTWMFLGYDIYDRHYLPAVEAPDARLFPLAKGSTFFDAIPMNDESVMVWCFPYEAHSCSIALQFRARLAGRVGTILNWNGFVTGLSPLPADFKGINIA